MREAKGSEHDFKVFKDTIGKGISNSIPLDADSGYQGIKEYHANSFIPVKSGKNHKLTEEEKAYNKELAGRRVVIEHINAKIKNPRRKRRGIEDFSLKSLRMRGNKSPAPPVYALKGGELNSKGIKE